MKKKNRDGTGIPFTFYVPANKVSVVKDFDYIAEELKEKNRSQEIISIMERYVDKYSEKETEEEVEVEDEAEEEVEEEEEAD